MKLRDYYFGKPVTLHSPLRPDEIAERIKAQTKVSWWMRPFQTGPVGGVRWGRLRLRYFNSPFQYNAKPLLIGRMESTMTGTVMRLVYRGDTWSRVFFLLWYVFMAVIAMFFLAAGFDPPLHGAEKLFPLAVLALLAVTPIIMHAIGTSRSDEDLAELIDFLERVAQAKRSHE